MTSELEWVTGEELLKLDAVKVRGGSMVTPDGRFWARTGHNMFHTDGLRSEAWIQIWADTCVRQVLNA